MKKLKRRPKNKKTSKKHSILEIAIVVIPSLILLIIVSMVVLITKKAENYYVSDTVAQYYANQEFKLSPPAFFMNKKGEYYVHNEDLEYPIDPIPFYYKNKSVLVTTSDMVYFAPREDIVAKVNGLSEVNFENGNLSLIKNNHQKNMKPGFLFDGDNVYIFLEPVTLKFDGYSINLGKMSYVEANNSNEMMIYNHDNGEMFMKQPKTKVTAESANGEYTVSLLSDSMELSDGTMLLLFNRPDQLDLYFK